MKLVQKHLIKFNHKNYSVIDKLGFLSKNLYNCAVYLNRQVFFSHQPFLTMTESKNRQINLQESLSCQDTKTRKKVETF